MVCFDKPGEQAVYCGAERAARIQSRSARESTERGTKILIFRFFFVQFSFYFFLLARFCALRKIEQDNCIQQIVNETDFVARKTLVVQRFARFQSNLGNLATYIAGYPCYVRMTDNNDFLTIYGHRARFVE